MSVADGMIGIKSKKEARRELKRRSTRQRRDCRVCGGSGFMDIDGGDCKHCRATGVEYS